MKLIAAGIASFSMTAFASFDDINDQVAAIVEESGLFTRDITSLMTNIAPLAEGYGCYCMFADIAGSGRGEAKDGVDGLCKHLNDAYSCIAHEEAECNPSTKNYNRISPTATDIWQDCALSNMGDTCAIKTCAADNQFSKSYSTLSMDKFREVGLDAVQAAGNILNLLISDAFKHPAPNSFDFDQQCPKNPGTTFGDKQCCGSYPLKFPYRDQNGGRDCCVDKVFNTATHSCCNDQVTFGSC